MPLFLGKTRLRAETANGWLTQRTAANLRQPIRRQGSRSAKKSPVKITATSWECARVAAADGDPDDREGSRS